MSQIMKASLINSINGENDYSDRIEITQDEVSEIQVDDYHRKKKPCKEENDCFEFLKYISLG